MKAIAIRPGKSGAYVVERPEPVLESEYDIKVRVLEVGICGTDREEVAGGRALAPPGSEELVIGHEMFGQVIAVGSAVTRVKEKDYGVFSVRRSCGSCLPCAMNRSDMCRTGNYRERGIWGLDGYHSEYVVDNEQYVVRVPEEVAQLGVLIEPLSVVEKAIDETVRVQAVRLPAAPATPAWLHGRQCLVAGLGPIGLLAAMALRLRGAEVFGLDIVDTASSRPRWLAEIGGKYIDGRNLRPDQIPDHFGPMELIFEGTGVAILELNLLDALSVNGAYVMTGIPGGNQPIELSGAELVRRMVLRNLLTVGSVNACRDHLQLAVDDLVAARLRWPNHLEKLISHRYIFADAPEVLAKHPPDEIKAVISWGKIEGGDQQ